jgi:hypothetical protein
MMDEKIEELRTAVDKITATQLTFHFILHLPWIIFFYHCIFILFDEIYNSFFCHCPVKYTLVSFA